MRSLLKVVGMLVGALVSFDVALRFGGMRRDRFDPVPVAGLPAAMALLLAGFASGLARGRRGHPSEPPGGAR
jgi:hypothetical protein